MNGAASLVARSFARGATRRPLWPRCTAAKRPSSATAAAAGDSSSSSSSSSKSNTTGNNKSNRGPSDSMEQARTRLARSALERVPRHGWTKEAIAVAASEDPKLSLSMSGMLSPSDLVGWFLDDLNRELRERKREEGDGSSSGGEGEPFDSIRWRLEKVLPFVESGRWHTGMAVGLSTPLETRSRLHEFIELATPPRHAGNTAYQAALGAIFLATELHLLSDASPGKASTWSFLGDRLEELERGLPEGKSPGLSDLPGVLASLAASAPAPPSPEALANATNSIPVVAGLAVARSLVEGAASLVLPQPAAAPRKSPVRSPPGKEADNAAAPAGTRETDYLEGPSPR
ncbi:unnamed protein product [Pseudo-nitzschia multistriata]|uniref:Ubiquinone biosynthesis protein n=1 Tax=Pseudo-nitzschia multistriata TaxID=183589 RepID=A0A448ZH17_9STRA|nr:unnamed protein product [Pseudo-nitzschia multistriata]